MHPAEAQAAGTRKARDGQMYTKAQFLEHYGHDTGDAMWKDAAQREFASAAQQGQHSQRRCASEGTTKDKRRTGRLEQTAWQR